VVAVLCAALALIGLPASAGPVAAPEVGLRACFFGDSLMAGTGASPRRPVMADVAAAQLGWRVDVDAWGGTGYTTSGESPSYLDRLRRPGALSGEYDVVLLEGGTNDARVGSSPAQVQAAVREVVAHVRARQPTASIVLMGAYDPPPPGRVVPHRTVVDDAIAQVAAELGLSFFTRSRAGGRPASRRRSCTPTPCTPTPTGTA
jgi:lysophospholipase L1-like esterase